MATGSAVTHVATSSSLHSKSSANHHDGLVPSVGASFNLPDLYRALRETTPSPELKNQADGFLLQQLQIATQQPCNLPADSEHLETTLSDWVTQHTEQVGHQYRAYLESRAQGAPRQFFSNRAHALYFLQAVAPTKLVDGAWLYGLVKHWRDPRFSSLIQIYLEELGNGVTEHNHVALYRKLLARHGLDNNVELSDAHYVQGTIQLALAYQAEQFLPELIGYNLGYEQLPLHLLITAYELNELGIDPYYFTLHITVDNAASGHARSALKAVLDSLPLSTDRASFYRRLRNGYQLNELGESSLSVIRSFDLYQELVQSLARKSRIGRLMHSNYCRLDGRTVNEWLGDPAQIPDFLHALEERGWIKRHQPVEESRFWRLIHGEQAEMFGVFSDYEQQLIHDWIVGNLHLPTHKPAQADTPQSIPASSFRARQRQLRSTPAQPRASKPQTPRPVFRHHHGEAINDINRELRHLENTLSALTEKEEVLDQLVPLLSPARHHTPSGLMATRIFTRLFSG